MDKRSTDTLSTCSQIKKIDESKLLNLSIASYVKKCTFICPNTIDTTESSLLLATAVAKSKKHRAS